MTHLLHVVFKAEDIQKLLESSPDKIVVRTSLERGILEDGRAAGYVVVKADAVREGVEEPLETVDGCPIPPCSP